MHTMHREQPKNVMIFCPNEKNAFRRVRNESFIIFDEPFSGLGDQEIDEVVTVLKKFTHDKTILVIEHKVSKLEEFVDRLAVMHEGEIIACGGCQATLDDPQVRQCYWKLDT